MSRRAAGYLVPATLATYLATASIWGLVSRPPNARMPPPPLVTCRCTTAAVGFRASQVRSHGALRLRRYERVAGRAVLAEHRGAVGRSAAASAIPRRGRDQRAVGAEAAGDDLGRLPLATGKARGRDQRVVLDGDRRVREGRQLLAPRDPSALACEGDDGAVEPQRARLRSRRCVAHEAAARGSA